tara:strand:- start:201872 stop:202075 length:204 start_codon:yes stop_codon:yes gene_type:complete
MKTKNISPSENKVNMTTYLDDYLEIMKTTNGDFISNTEWKSQGDQFKKLSMYEDYTPVQTSSNTQTS